MHLNKKLYIFEFLAGEHWRRSFDLAWFSFDLIYAPS